MKIEPHNAPNSPMSDQPPPSGEPNSVFLFYQTEDGKNYETQFYNLDVIISVG